MCVPEFKFLNTYLTEAQPSRECLKSELYRNHNTFLDSAYNLNFFIFSNNIKLTLSFIILKNSQTYFENFAMWTSL